MTKRKRKVVGRKMMSVLQMHLRQLQQLQRRMKSLKVKQVPQKAA
jgi:hypothetical protein